MIATDGRRDADGTFDGGTCLGEEASVDGGLFARDMEIAFVAAGALAFATDGRAAFRASHFQSWVAFPRLAALTAGGGFGMLHGLQGYQMFAANIGILGKKASTCVVFVGSVNFLRTAEPLVGFAGSVGNGEWIEVGHHKSDHSSAAALVWIFGGGGGGGGGNATVTRRGLP